MIRQDRVVIDKVFYLNWPKVFDLRDFYRAASEQSVVTGQLQAKYLAITIGDWLKINN